MTGTTDTHGNYYLPNPSPYPIILSVSLFFLSLGFALAVNDIAFGTWSLLAGAALLLYVLFGWFGKVIGESRAGLYHEREDRSFRWGMIWFITSEVIFFAGLFGVLFYERNISVPWLASFSSHFTPWPGFTGAWPSSGPAGKAFTPMEAWGIPALNTLILLSSGVTVTWAHWGLRRNNRLQTNLGLFLTVALGLSFLVLQAHEYRHAYTHLGLTLGSGVYGSTFFILTGFHGLHVTLGVIMLSVILSRSLKGHFTSDHHFAFEAVSWYWHFVDVVWLLLFVFVYWL
ncbi:MAG: cytochrome c oxidase subunit 3 [Gammaproteobacteria bacterium]|nr:cytochrome c oxidase subunit 3 [Gammaproteobacteria bacterium]